MHATSRSRRTTAERGVEDANRAAKRRSRLIGVVLIACTLAAAVSFATVGAISGSHHGPTIPPFTGKADVTVDFGAAGRVIDPAAIGVDESTYGTPSDVADKKAQHLIKALGVGYSRLWVTLADTANPQSRVVCGAAGCDPVIDVAKWIQTMRALGEVPVIGFPDTLSAADAAAIVRRFAATAGKPVLYWVIGNEPNDAKEPAATYSAHFNTLYDAMKQVDPRIKIGGPATDGFRRPFIQAFLNGSGSRVDFVDFHFYPSGRESGAQLLGELPQLSADLTTLRAMINAAAPGRAPGIGIHVGEWNFSGDPVTLGQFAYGAFASMLDADLLGRILAAGADSLAFGSKNGPWSLIYGDGHNAPAGYTPDMPMPLYRAIGIFTGEGLFPHFGTTMVRAPSVLPAVDAFASSAPDELILVNKGAATLHLLVHVVSDKPQAATIWQLNQKGATPSLPVKVASLASLNGAFNVVLPGHSVTTLVIKTQVSDR
jgi:hypothetical protein